MATVASVSIGNNWTDVIQRRSTLKQLFRVGKLLVICACLLVLLLIIVQLLNSFLELDTHTSKLHNEVQSAVLRVEAASQTSEEKPNYRQIARYKPFGELKPQTVEEAPTKVEKPVSNVPLTLIGVFITTGEKPYAIIEDKKKKEQGVFMINDNVHDAATLAAIFPNRVEITRGGATEVLRLDDGPRFSDDDSSSGAAAGDVVAVDEEEVDKALDNLPLLLTQARAVPYFKDGKSIGLRLFAIKKDSLYEKIGLKNGDILKSINDNSLGDITQAVKLFEKLREERSISLTLERNRADKVIRYEIQ